MPEFLHKPGMFRCLLEDLPVGVSVFDLQQRFAFGIEAPGTLRTLGS